MWGETKVKIKIKIENKIETGELGGKETRSIIRNESKKKKSGK